MKARKPRPGKKRVIAKMRWELLKRKTVAPTSPLLSPLPNAKPAGSIRNHNVPLPAQEYGQLDQVPQEVRPADAVRGGAPKASYEKRNRIPTLSVSSSS